MNNANEEFVACRQVQGNPYQPPHDRGGKEETYFGAFLPEQFVVPHRLRSKPTELIETVNDWHFAMINDQPRNRFYQTLLREVITPDSVVLEIGAGSGLLSIMAAKAGAKKVIAIEANREMATLATQIIAANGMSDRIEVINRMSTDVHLHDLSAVPTILVSEILGTLLLGESALHYVQDARARLVTPGAAILPKLGTQYVTLIESEEVHRITAVCSWEDIDLRHFNALQDTTSLVFTKQYGFRFSSCPHRFLSGKLPVLKIDFACAQTETAFPEEQRVRFQATATGQAHAVLASWDVSDGARKEVMSTHPDDTIDNFPRDMQWGQALQLLEDSEGLHQPQPTPLMVTAGEWLVLVIRYARDGVNFQCQVEREGAAGAAMEHDGARGAQWSGQQPAAAAQLRPGGAGGAGQKAPAVAGNAQFERDFPPLG